MEYEDSPRHNAFMDQFRQRLIMRLNELQGTARQKNNYLGLIKLVDVVDECNVGQAGTYFLSDLCNFGDIAYDPSGIRRAEILPVPQIVDADVTAKVEHRAIIRHNTIQVLYNRIL